MKPWRAGLVLAAALALGAGAPAAETAKPEPREVKIFMRDGLRFDPPRFAATPGEELLLQIENGDATDLTHNFALIRPGTRESVVREALALAEQGPAHDYVPAGPEILAYSHLLATGSAATVKFTLPAAPGIYPYVCTFPGHGMVMFGAIYSGVPMPEITKDPNIPPSSAQTLLAGGGRRPFTQRIFMPGAGPAAVAVALAGNQNFCWDAGECRLRYAWQGDFVDAAEHWAGNGNVLAKLPAEPWWRAPRHDFPLRFGPADSAAPVVKFLGYRTTPAGPEFHYSAGGEEVFEQILPRRDGPGLALHYRIPQAAGPVAYRAEANAAAQWSSPSGPIVGGALRLSAGQARDFTLLLTSEACRP